MSSRVEEIALHLEQVRSSIPAHVQLIVVTKNFPISDLEILYGLGERNFGENRVQELVSKRESLPREVNENVTWHFQGQIQSNKIASLNRYADVIHSVDSLKAVEKISSDKKVFLQVNLDLDSHVDSNRGGIKIADLEKYAVAMRERFAANFLGVMGVAPHSVNEDEKRAQLQISDSFKRLHSYSLEVMQISPEARFISAGMSDDFRQAIEEGATHIRLGSSILGQRLPRA